MLIHNLIAGLVVTIPLFVVRRAVKPEPDLEAIDRALAQTAPVSLPVGCWFCRLQQRVRAWWTW